MQLVEVLNLSLIEDHQILDVMDIKTVYTAMKKQATSAIHLKFILNSES
jgi:hypothetical protein